MGVTGSVRLEEALCVALGVEVAAVAIGNRVGRGRRHREQRDEDRAWNALDAELRRC